ncbi:MAG: hypothetical protein ABS78_19420 [Phenylobacterium sp. SCN 70-31]|nr:MAG: hypothetical protein ABS78_19420 [Phenylobacterium sp. SCN 70-31]
MVATGAAFVKTNADFQQLQAQLVTVTGSTEKASAAFAALQQFAKETPFSLQEVTEAFTKMQAYGLKTSEESLRSFGDTASAMGKSLDQFVEAVADAVTGEFERLKEFGIKSKTVADGIVFTFKGVSTKVGKDAESIQNYLEGIGKTDFAGSMERQAQTIKGAFSNLTDSIQQTFFQLGENGLNDAMVGIIQSVTDAVPKIRDFIAAFSDTSGLSTFITAVQEVIANIQQWMGQTTEFAGVVATNGEHIINAFLTAAKVVGDVVGTIVSGLSEIVKAVYDAGKATVEAFQAYFETGVGKIVKTTMIGVVNAIEVAVKFIVRAVLAIPKAFIEAFTAAAKTAASFYTRLNSLIKGNLGAFAGFGSEVAGYLGKPFETLGDLAKATVSDINTAIKDTSAGSITAIKELGNAYQEVDKKRRAAAEAAKADAGKSVDMSALNSSIVTPKKDTSVEDEKARKKAAQELKDFESRVKSLTDTYAPAIARNIEWTQAQADFNRLIALGDEGLKKYGLTVDQVKTMMADAKETINSSFFDKALADARFDEATIKASEFSDAASVAAEQVRQIGRAAKEAHEALSPAQEAELKSQLQINEATRQAIELRKKQADANEDLAKSTLSQVQALNDEATLLDYTGKERDRQQKLLEFKRSAEASGASIEAQAKALRDYTAALDGLEAKKESLNTFANGAKQALTEFAENAEDIAGRSKDAIGGILGGLEQGFQQFFKTGKFGMKDFLKTVADEMAAFAAKGTVLLLLKLFGLTSGGGGIFGGLLGGLFADGGSPPVGRVSVVGERAPEVFVPKAPGNILNRSQLRALGVGANDNTSGGNKTVVVNLGGINIEAGASVTADDLAAFGNQITRNVGNEIMDQLRHNGVLYGR